MTEEVRHLSRRRIATDILATILGIVALILFVFLGTRTALFVGVYGLLLGTSTAVVTYCLTRFTGIAIGRAEGGETRTENEKASNSREEVWRIFTGQALESDSDIEEDTGWLIGRLENILILSLVIAGEYTALSIIFAAKSWVRREDTATQNTTYYLAGTLVNFTYSIVVGIGTVQLLELL
ncbi:hypothetical protein NGM10_08440 [Halorussus salilacus]|uniref:hypothetical protein n=1 Tax=Halorussus salilacus TaxID=2953750 RepID=UPI00209E0F1F|nr:hypothetical protein [Halorussus salilacus]USZ66764.1 hypothetical protein NGM10_08440 [Halorussus salilacus]